MMIPGNRTQGFQAAPHCPWGRVTCLLGVLILGFGSRLEAEELPAIEAPAPTWYYSTAPPPRTFEGPVPATLAFDDSEAEADPEPMPSEADDELPEPEPLPSESEAEADAEAPVEAEEESAPRLAAASPDRVPPHALADPARSEPIAAIPEADAVPETNRDPIPHALALIQQSLARYEAIRDYTCIFVKRERIKGRLQAASVMAMKARTQPRSVYFKFLRPNAGREAIYVHGRNQGKALVHDVGIGKFLAGTLALDPRSSRAMDGNRHPITEAGIGNLIDTLWKHWKVELIPGFSQVVIKENVQVNKRPCLMIVSTQPRHDPRFLFHEVRVYIDRELGLPIRFEAYDWPQRPGVAPELVEEYTYLDLKLNVGLTDHDFDPSNKEYSFGRF